MEALIAQGKATLTIAARKSLPRFARSTLMIQSLATGSLLMSFTGKA